jgi:imidazole glycerol-phosphate synthase subunit HisH
MKYKHVQLIDAGTGNLQSVFNALQEQGAQISVVTNPDDWKTGISTILPGVGAFQRFMSGLQQRNLIEPILQIVQSEIPLMGICVGMQAFFEYSEEMGNSPGLGIIPGSVIRFAENSELKIPHTGWNEINLHRESKLFKEINSGSYFYFNHSYYCSPAQEQYETAETEYILPFTSAVGWKNIFGVQFHPEKSQSAGLKLLGNFLSI